MISFNHTGRKKRGEARSVSCCKIERSFRRTGKETPRTSSLMPYRVPKQRQSKIRFGLLFTGLEEEHKLVVETAFTGNTNGSLGARAKNFEADLSALRNIPVVTCERTKPALGRPY